MILFIFTDSLKNNTIGAMRSEERNGYRKCILDAIHEVR